MQCKGKQCKAMQSNVRHTNTKNEMKNKKKHLIGVAPGSFFGQVWVSPRTAKISFAHLKQPLSSVRYLDSRGLDPIGFGKQIKHKKNNKQLGALNTSHFLGGPGPGPGLAGVVGSCFNVLVLRESYPMFTETHRISDLSCTGNLDT